MQRRHSMPFGAELLDDGRVRFRLWAPAADAVEVCLGAEGTECLPLQRDETGWHELVTDQAGAGFLYSFRIDGGTRVPDPASRFQPHDVHGPSEVIDPGAWDWQDDGWRGRPWEEAVIYELHVGSFTPDGAFSGVTERLEHLVQLGVTAIELMPLSDFPGARNWGYDGVLPYAPDSSYGRPEDLKALVDAAHARGLMVLLDIVYNHFGPEGNYLHLYAPQFFNPKHTTPWGAAINYDGEASHWVRQYFIHNALFWLEEYHLDGFRMDAVNTICDDSDPHILLELAAAVRSGPGAQRHVHLTLEDDRNLAGLFERDEAGQPVHFTAQWNDDIHHALHVAITGESDGYYGDYSAEPLRYLGRCLAEGFGYQGEVSAYRDGKVRGTPSAHLPPSAFVSFLQNHDQVGNRAFGERITAVVDAAEVRAALAIMLLAPSPPLLFMGQEWAASQPFLFFCDFEPELARKVTRGRRQEYASCPGFSDPAARRRIPDPAAAETFERTVLDWDEPNQPGHKEWLELHRRLLALRREEILPRLEGMAGGSGRYRLLTPTTIVVSWQLGCGSHLDLVANLGPEVNTQAPLPAGRLLYTTDPESDLTQGRLPAWFVAWSLRSGDAAQ